MIRNPPCNTVRIYGKSQLVVHGSSTTNLLRCDFPLYATIICRMKGTWGAVNECVVDFLQVFYEVPVAVCKREEKDVGCWERFTCMVLWMGRQ
jgi:hypothetical protein